MSLEFQRISPRSKPCEAYMICKPQNKFSA